MKKKEKGHNRNILHTLKKEPLNIMLLHTSRSMDGPRIKTVPVVSHIFDVSSSTGLGRVKEQALYFLPQAGQWMALE